MVSPCEVRWVRLLYKVGTPDRQESAQAKLGGESYMELLMRWLLDAPLWQAILALLGENVLILCLALAFGNWLVRRYEARRVSLPALPLQRLEVGITLSSVLLNTVVTVVGLLLW